jgi:hypothetical protein
VLEPESALKPRSLDLELQRELKIPVEIIDKAAWLSQKDTVRAETRKSTQVGDDFYDVSMPVNGLEEGSREL